MTLELLFDAVARDPRDPQSEGSADITDLCLDGEPVKTNHPIERAARKLLDLVLEKQIHDNDPDNG